MSVIENRDRMVRLQAKLLEQVEHRLAGMSIADAVSCTVCRAIADLSVAISASDPLTERVNRLKESKN